MTPSNHEAGAVDAYQMDLLRQLVAFKSVNPPGDEKPVAEFLARELSGLGFSVETPDVAANRGNVVARLYGGDGPEIALCGHLDVVAADADQWTRDPFVLWESEGRVYGRGVCDMKGAISAMVAAARDLTSEGREFSGTFTLIFVADEEDATLGTRHYVATGAKPDAVIIGEPTDMDVCVAHRGVARYQVDVVGRSGHASRPDEANNPITIAARLAGAIDLRNKTLSRIAHPILPPPTIAVTMIEAAEQPNTIPGRCRLTIDRRTLPDEDRKALIKELEALRRTLPEEDRGAVGEAVFTVLTQAGNVLPGSELPELCKEALSRLGVEARVRDFPAGCDQFAFFEAGIDCLLVGPGSISQAHSVDEYISQSQLSLAKIFYREFIREWLQWKTI